MKYIITILLGQMSLSQASEIPIWQKHSLYHLNADNKIQTGSFVTVGSDNNCDYRVGSSKIQDAIDDGHTEIRIVTDTYLENLTIDDRSIALYGGYANCLAATNGQSDGNQVIVDANGAGTVLAIPQTSQRQTITIENINFTNGLNGMITSDADAMINLQNVWFSNNNGGISSGGGMSINGGNTDILGIDLLVASNTSWFGGGILCSGANNSILIDKADHFAGISINQATNGDGGGAWITDGCVLSVYAGTNLGFPDLNGITGNSATNHGGGIAVTNGAQLNLIGFEFCSGNNCLGNDTEPVNLTANIADFDEDDVGNGGAIYVDGENSEVYAITININNNKASNGAGIAVENDGYLKSYSENKTCWSSQSCNQLHANEAINTGGAVFVSTGAFADIGPSHLYNNRADFGTAGFVNQDSSRLFIEGSMIFKNGSNGMGSYADNRVFLINGTALNTPVLKLTYNTIVDNQATGSLISNFSGVLNLLSSIVHDSNGIDLYSANGSTTDTIDCVIAHEISSLPTGGATTQAVVDDPMFINRQQSDYHLDATTSPAIDFCGKFLADAQYLDTDDQLRGWDDPLVANFDGPYDIGADESYDNDIIFQNNFEN